MACPENSDEDDDDHYDGKNSPGNLEGGLVGKIFAARAHIFGARQVKFGKFLDLDGRLGFHRRELGFDAASLLCRCRRRLRFGWDRARRFGLPDFVGVDLRLAQAGEIVGNGFFVVESEMLRVGANESFIEHAAGELIEVFFFDGLEHAGADLGDVGNVIEREFFFLARLAEFISEFAHVGPAGKRTGTS